MTTRGAMGLCMLAGVLCGAAAGQGGTWEPMVITADDVGVGMMSDLIVVREEIPVSGVDRRVGALELTPAERGLHNDGLIRSSRRIVRLTGMAGMEDTVVSYRVVRVADLADVAAVQAEISMQDGVTAERVVVGASTADTPTDRPNDPLFAIQYALENAGQVIGGVPGASGADIRVVRAWELQQGSADVSIAVIDSGVASGHPDLAGKVDTGINVTGGPADDTDAQFNPHGTQIAGIVAANTNNAQGVVGVSWGSRIVPVKAANALGFTSDVWLAEGLVWAVDQGVDVAVISFGLGAPSAVLADAVRYAYENGTIVCASTGNTGAAGVLYPAAYPETIAVGATDSTDTLAVFSNTGPEVDLVAPGVNIFSTSHTMFAPNTYSFATGTSVSTPMVAGVAALLRSADPTLTPDQVLQILGETARDLSSLGRDNSYGYGRINAYRALALVMGQEWCYADIDGNEIVQTFDFNAWISAYSRGSLRADQNRNGVVEPADLSLFILNYSQQFGVCD